MKPTYLIAILLSFALLNTGCKVLTPSQVVVTDRVMGALKPVISQAVVFACKQDKNVPAYFRAADLAICSLAEEGTFSPEDLAKALQSTSVNEFKTMSAQVAENTVLAIYGATYADRFHANVQANEFAKRAVQTLCDGIADGLAQAKGILP